MKSALAVMAMFLGQSQTFKIEQQSLGYETEGIEVLVDTGSHIEMGVKAETDTKANAMSEQKMEAQANLKIASQAPPDVYGPNGDNYANNNPQYDYSRIKIDIHEPGSGPKCM